MCYARAVVLLHVALIEVQSNFMSAAVLAWHGVCKKRPVHWRQTIMTLIPVLRDLLQNRQATQRIR